MNLKIFDLRCFIALCTYKNFTKAADKMCISQPPFSRIIQKLESEMGSILIDRPKGSFVLTSLGKTFLEEAQQIVREYESSMRRIEILRNPKSEELKVGFTSFAAQMPGFYELVDSLSKEASEIYLEELPSQGLCEKLQNHELDMGITHFPPNLKSLLARSLKACKAAVLFPQQVCCFIEKMPYKLILDENKLDKPYNQQLLKNFPSYQLTPLYKRSAQLCPQLALQGRGILIYPEPTARIINMNNTFTFEEIDKAGNLFGMYMVTHKTPFKRLIETVLRDRIQV